MPFIFNVIFILNISADYKQNLNLYYYYYSITVFIWQVTRPIIKVLHNTDFIFPSADEFMNCAKNTGVKAHIAAFLKTT